MFPDFLTDDSFRLETRRLWLRWPRASDIPALVKYADNLNVAQFTEHLPHPYKTSDADEFVRKSRQDNAGAKAIKLAITAKNRPNELIGSIGAEADEDRSIAIGYWLGEPFWGKGLMGEAVDEINALAFRTMALDRIKAYLVDGNTRSEHLLARRGFKPTGSGPYTMPLRGGTFMCTQFNLEKQVWRHNELERYKRQASRPVT